MLIDGITYLLHSISEEE